MVNDNPSGEKIIKTKDGKGTGDRVYQTAGGRWWIKWDGKTRTGQDIKRLYF